MSRPPFEVADLVRTAGTAFIERNRRWIRWTHIKVLLAIARCRTAALGGHIDECTRCGHRATISYNSCRNRLFQRAAHLEPKTPASSPCPLCRRRGWALTRSHPLDSISPALLSPHSGAAACVSRQVRRRSQARFPASATQLLGRSVPPRSAQDLRCLAQTTVSKRLDRLLQTTLRRPRVCAPVSGPLHPPSGHLQPSPDLVGQRPSHLWLARLRSQP